MSALLPIYPPRRFDPAPELAGRLSPAEMAFADEANARTDEDSARVSALTIHGKAVQRARDARMALLQALTTGQRVHEAVDAHARAQCWLREAAQAVCDICDFPDNGRAAGVVWETPLAQEADRG